MTDGFNTRHVEGSRLGMRRKMRDEIDKLTPLLHLQRRRIDNESICR